MSFVVGSGMQLIGKNVLGSAAASVAFSSIPQNFNHLKILFIARVSGSTTVSNVKIQFNSDTGSNYDDQYILGNNASASSGTDVGATSGILSSISGASDTANCPGMGETIIPAYTNTTFYKMVTTSGGLSPASASVSRSMVVVTQWRNTAAITSLLIINDNSSNFITGSSFYLYGII